MASDCHATHCDTAPVSVQEKLGGTTASAVAAGTRRERFTYAPFASESVRIIFTPDMRHDSEPGAHCSALPTRKTVHRMMGEAVIQLDVHRRKMHSRKHSGPTLIVVLPLAIGFGQAFRARCAVGRPFQ
jgi:hypothetical protein